MALPLRFGAYELDTARLELRHRGVAVPLQPKALDLLTYLVRHRERVVTRDELLSALWSDVVVTEASLSKAVSAARRALREGGAEGAIATVRGRGFRFTAPVEESPASAGPRVQPVREATFVGREDLLAAFDAAFEAAHHGRGRLLLIPGEAGMGKTRTIQEADVRGRALGLRVLHGWCHEAEGAPDLWPWLVAVRQILERDEVAGLTEELGAGVAELAELLPGLRARLPAEREGDGLDPASARFRRLETLVEVFERVTREKPHLLLLDDFHRADPDSLALLRFVLRSLGEVPLVVVAAHRLDELPVGHPLLDLARVPHCESWPLTGLSRAHVTALVQAELGRDVSDREASSIWERSGGNPFFVKELARGLPADAPSEVAGEGDTLPAGIRNVLHERIERLSEACRRILQLAGLLGRDLDVALLARASAEPPQRVLQLIDEAVAEHVLEPVAGGFRFAHGLVREGLLADVPGAERARLHRTIGEALRTLYRDDLDPHLGRLAHHFCAGAAAGCAEQAVEFSRRAGDRAVGLHAHREAADHYGRALAAQPLVAHSDDAGHCDLLLALGEASMAAGEPEAGRAALERAAEIARRLASPERLARAALAAGGLELSSQVGTDDPALVALLRESLHALPARPSALAVRLRTRLGEALYWSDWDGSSREIEQAVADGRRLGDSVALGYALHGRHWLGFVGRGPGAPLEGADEMVALARRAEHRELALAGHSARFLVLLQLGRGVEAGLELARYEELARQLRVPRYRWRGHCYHAALASLEGRFHDVARAAERTLAEEELFLPRDAVGTMLLFFLHREQGRPPDTDVIDLATRLPAFSTTWRAAVAMLLADAGRIEEAREALTTLVERDFVQVPQSFTRLAELVLCADACAAVGDGKLAAALGSQLEPYGNRMVVMGGGFFCLGSVELFLGRLASTAGQETRARAHLRAAFDANLQSGARPWVAWTRYELARLEAASDPAAARSHRAEALGAAEAMEMGRLARAATALAP